MIKTIINEKDIDKADVVLMSAAYEETASSHKGTVHGPKKVIECLDKQIEFFDRKFKVAWNTFEVQEEKVDFYNVTPKVKYYTLNPAWNINKNSIKDIEATGAKIIPVCLSYNNKESDRMLYWHSLLRGLEFIMVDYLEDFINYCEEYNIPIYNK